jgi:hypothetical protein
MSSRVRDRNSRHRNRPGVSEILGDHPVGSHPLGDLLLANDGMTVTQVPHRALAEKAEERPALVDTIREALIRHHVSQEAYVRAKQYEPVAKYIAKCS